jgi:hypothetical protein
MVGRSSCGSISIPEGIEKYGLDVYFRYFFEPHAPKELSDWVVRRWTHFAAGMTEIVAIISAWIVSLTIIVGQTFGITPYTFIIALFSVLFCIVCWCNALLSRREALQLLDLWSFANFDEKGQEIFKHFEENIAKKPKNS